MEWWHWLLIALGSLVGLIALMALIGSFLPREHVASRSARFNQSPEEVWQVITDFATRPQWFPLIRSAERLPDENGHQVWRESFGHGQGVAVEIVEWDPPRRFVGQIQDDPKMPFGGRWIHELVPVDGGCRLTLTEDGWVSNPVFRFLARFAFGYTATLEQFLRALGKKLGQDVRIEV